MSNAAWQCTYRWKIVKRRGASSVLHFRHCQNMTRHPSQQCWVHRGQSGRFDERLA